MLIQLSRYPPLVANRGVPLGSGWSGPELVRRAVAGDAAAFADLVRNSAERLYGTALRVTRDPSAADDAVQETLIEAWRKLGSLREPDRFDAWVARILIRRCYRQGMRRLTVSNVEMTIDMAQPDPQASLADRDELERAFARLAAKHRAVLVLRYYLGLEPAELADVLQVRPGTARSRLHYALDALRGELASERRVGGRRG